MLEEVKALVERVPENVKRTQTFGMMKTFQEVEGKVSLTGCLVCNQTSVQIDCLIFQKWFE